MAVFWTTVNKTIGHLAGNGRGRVPDFALRLGNAISVGFQALSASILNMASGEGMPLLTHQEHVSSLRIPPKNAVASVNIPPNATHFSRFYKSDFNL